MVDFEADFRLEKMKSGNAAFCLLKEQFESFATSPQRAGACEWIASCFYELEQYGEAGDWYEVAGRLILSEPSAPPVMRALSAIGRYERALDCYRRGGAAEAAEECSSTIAELSRICAPA